jgi:hypothetical protein
MNVSAWEFIRAIRGPIMLIVFGTLMTLNHTDTLGFGQSWPILVIAYGLFKLLERLVARPVPPDAPPSWQPSTAPQYPPVYPPPQQGGTQ